MVDNDKFYDIKEPCPELGDIFLSAKISGKTKAKIEFANYKILPLLFGDLIKYVTRAKLRYHGVF